MENILEESVGILSSETDSMVAELNTRERKECGDVPRVCHLPHLLICLDSLVQEHSWGREVLVFPSGQAQGKKGITVEEDCSVPLEVLRTECSACHQPLQSGPGHLSLWAPGSHLPSRE